MTIILDNLTLPEKGQFEMDVKLSFDIADHGGRRRRRRRGETMVDG